VELSFGKNPCYLLLESVQRHLEILEPLGCFQQMVSIPAQEGDTIFLNICILNILYQLSKSEFLRN